MKSVDTIARVRRAFHVQGWSLKRISRELHVSRNTVSPDATPSTRLTRVDARMGSDFLAARGVIDVCGLARGFRRRRPGAALSPTLMGRRMGENLHNNDAADDQHDPDNSCGIQHLSEDDNADGCGKHDAQA